MKQKIPYLFAIALSLFTAAFFSCKTRSAVRVGGDALRKLAEMEEFEPFADGALLYLSIDAVNSRPILDLLTMGGMPIREAAQILDRTSTITAAFYPRVDPRFFAVFQGNYPKVLADLSLKAAADWKRRRSETGADYWRTEKDRLSIAFDMKTIAASDTDPFSFISNTALANTLLSVPQGFDEFRRGAVLAGWFGGGADALNALLMAMETPFEIQANRMLFSVTPKDEAYYVVLQIETPSENAARSLSQLFSIARLLGVKGIEQGGAPSRERDLEFFMDMLFSNPPERNGASLTLRLGPMDAVQTALLFNVFSVYFY
ncbi:MAG: hypothetical protein LBG05_01490 [Treponema sp.]|jgi:hypothetical protein|nr:hypothetical protein [Treponema sp.]